MRACWIHVLPLLRPRIRLTVHCFRLYFGRTGAELLQIGTF